MKILHVNDRLSTRGGADLHLLAVCGELVRSGHRVVLAVGVDDGTFRLDGQVSGFETVTIPELASRRSTGEVDAFKDLVAGLAPDVVHLHNVVNPNIPEACRDLPAVQTIQDHRFFCPGRGKFKPDGSICRRPFDPRQSDLCSQCLPDGRYRDEMSRLVGRRLAAAGGLRALIVLSDYMKVELTSCGIDASRVSVIPPFSRNFPSPPWTGRQDGTRSCGKTAVTSAGSRFPRAPVLFCGRLVRAKGVWEAVEAWRLSGVENQLVFAGTGSERQKLEAAGFSVLGWLDEAELADLYRMSSALIMPSVWQEPFGIAGLEALSFGLPVVSWSSGAVPEWHPGGELLVERGNIPELAAALAKAVPQRDSCSASGGLAQETTRRFDRKILMDRLIRLYRRTAGRELP